MASCATTDTEDACGEALEWMNAAQVKHQPEAISSRNVVLFAPTAPHAKGGEIAAEAYMSLPRAAQAVGAAESNSIDTVFTKVALVGHGDGGLEGISLGYDVCENSGIVDEQAVAFVRDLAMGDMGGVGPQVLICDTVMPAGMPGLCPHKRTSSLESQLPYIHNILAGHRLTGNLLPVMMQKQTEELASKVGDMVTRLVKPGGLWESERVLFVFGGDLSDHLERHFAIGNDTTITNLVATQGSVATAHHFDEMRSGHIWGGDEAIPKSFSTLLAAARAAEILGLTDHRIKLGDAGTYYTETDFDPENRVDGYASILFWDDDRYAGYTVGPNTLVHANVTRETKVVQPHHQKLLRQQNKTKTLF